MRNDRIWKRTSFVFQYAENYYRQEGLQSETVVIHHIVSVGTIDEDIMKVLENKDKTQAAMMSAVKARVK